MAKGDLDGDSFRKSFEEELKNNPKIKEGEFYFFYCDDDTISNRLKSIEELSDALKNERKSKPGKYIVRIISNNQDNDFGYAILKFFENFPDLTKGIIRIEKNPDRAQIYITNGGIEELIESSDAFDFYRRIILYSKRK